MGTATAEPQRSGGNQALVRNENVRNCRMNTNTATSRSSSNNNDFGDASTANIDALVMYIDLQPFVASKFRVSSHVNC